MKCPLTGKVCAITKFFHITDINNKKEVTAVDCFHECFTDYVKQGKEKEKEPLDLVKTMVEFVDFLTNKIPPAPEIALPPILPPIPLGKELSEEDLKKIEKHLPKCKTCGYTLIDVQKSGKLGCGECYDLFYPQLEKTLMHFHNIKTTSGLQHVGKIPLLKDESMEDELKELEEKLAHSVIKEDYKTAALVRDNIMILKKEIERKKNGPVD